MRTCKLMRTWYKTDADPAEPGYVGTFSDPIPMEDEDKLEGWRIVAVNWSERGMVEVTWLVPES